MSTTDVHLLSQRHPLATCVTAAIVWLSTATGLYLFFTRIGLRLLSTVAFASDAIFLLPILTVLVIFAVAVLLYSILVWACSIPEAYERAKEHTRSLLTIVGLVADRAHRFAHRLHPRRLLGSRTGEHHHRHSRALW